MIQSEIKKKKYMKTMIQIPHLELIFFSKFRKKIIFIFAKFKFQGRRKKYINQQEQFCVYSSFGKIRVGGLRNSGKNDVLTSKTLQAS